MPFRLLVVSILVLEVAILAFLSTVVSYTAVLLAAPVVPLTLVVIVVYRSRQRTSYRLWRVTPERITGYEPQAEPQSTPEGLSKSIVERAAEIRRAMLDEPTEVQVEMCALGYRACVDDMITLTHLVNEELPDAGFLQQMRLNRTRRRAADALNAARQALPPGALRATHQEQQ